MQRRNFIIARNKLNEFTEAKQGPQQGPARRAAFDLYTLLVNAVEDLQLAPDGTPNPRRNEATLSESEAELLLNRLRVIADAQTAEDQRKFTINEFSAAFPDDDPSGFERFFGKIHSKSAS